MDFLELAEESVSKIAIVVSLQGPKFNASTKVSMNYLVHSVKYIYTTFNNFIFTYLYLAYMINVHVLAVLLETFSFIYH